jgi:hypothetical protein
VNAIRIVALLSLFSAAPAAAQSPPPFLVINNTSESLVCSSRAPDGQWQPWFEIQPAANWVAANGSQELLFQCHPPVEQVSYTLKAGERYSLLPFGTGIKLVQIQAR